MSFKLIIDNLNDKGQPILEAGRDLYRYINTHGAFYDKVRASAGKPLDQLTDAQINDYFGVTLSAEAMQSVKAFLAVFEAFMSTQRDLINTLPANDVG